MRGNNQPISRYQQQKRMLAEQKKLKFSMQTSTSGLEHYDLRSGLVKKNSTKGSQQLGKSKFQRRAMNKKQVNLQFKKYLLDTENVFYEDRPDALILEAVQGVKPYNTKIFGILLLAYIILSFVTPFNGPCPVNADCGVFIHCHYGYQLKQNRCQISQSSRNEAKSLCIASIENLKTQYGNKQCSEPDSDFNMAPSKQIYQIIKQFEVSSRATETQMYTWLQDSANQKIHKFIHTSQGVQPLQKKYSTTCKAKLIYSSQNFTPYFCITILIIAIIYFLVHRFILKMKAEAIYLYLEEEINRDRSKEILVDRKAIQVHFGYRVNGKLWGIVDGERVKHRSIGYYEDQSLHWRKLD